MAGLAMALLSCLGAAAQAPQRPALCVTVDPGGQAGRPGYAWMGFRDGDGPWRALEPGKNAWRLAVADSRGRYALAWVDDPEQPTTRASVNVLVSDLGSDPRLALPRPCREPAPEAASTDLRLLNVPGNAFIMVDSLLPDGSNGPWGYFQSRTGTLERPGWRVLAGVSFRVEPRGARLAIAALAPPSRAWDGYTLVADQPLTRGGSPYWTVSARNAAKGAVTVALPDLHGLPGWKAAWELTAASAPCLALTASHDNLPWRRGFGIRDIRDGLVQDGAMVIRPWPPGAQAAPDAAGPTPVSRP
jgi:hypothetical protein